MTNWQPTEAIAIIRQAWRHYDSAGQAAHIKSIEDFSPRVSTNHVYRILFEDDRLLFAKLSHFGRYEHFVQDHTIIEALANLLPPPYENFLARSLTCDGRLFTYRHQGLQGKEDAWVAFYHPMKTDQHPARQQTPEQIRILGHELAHFHRACYSVSDHLPPNSKTIQQDIEGLRQALSTDPALSPYHDEVAAQCDTLEQNLAKIGTDTLPAIPVFVDWNIGNFSVNRDYRFFARWDYDWFRMDSRVMDFFFFSRVCSAAGDQTVFSYRPDTLMEDRFLLFLQSYHAVYPLTETEVRLVREAYRFFILNYVIKYGHWFFHPAYAARLRQEAIDIYFPSLASTYHTDTLLKAIDP